MEVLGGVHVAMLKRFGLYILALGLILHALSGQAQQHDEKPQGAVTEEQVAPQVFPIPLPVQIIETDAAADARQRSEDEAKERELRDLAAQQGMQLATEAMNDATQRMANYAYWSTWIVGLGTGLLFVTLWLTWGANKAARDAVAVTREVGQREARANVFVAMAEVDITQNRIAVRLSLKNGGHTYALNVKGICSGTMFIKTTNPSDEMPSLAQIDLDVIGFDIGVVAPNETVPTDGLQWVSASFEREYQAIFSDASGHSFPTLLSVSAHYEWQDEFGHSHKVESLAWFQVFNRGTFLGGGNRPSTERPIFRGVGNLKHVFASLAEPSSQQNG